MGDKIEFEARPVVLGLADMNDFNAGRLVIQVPAVSTDPYRRYRVTMEPVEPELKPCPFCGSELNVWQDTFGEGDWVIECQEYECDWGKGHFATQAEAIQWANRSADD